MILLQYPFMNKGRKVNYFSSDHPVSSFETDRKKFLGDNEYGSFRDPLSLRASELTNTVALRGDNIAALMHHLGSLAPGEVKQVITQLGQAPDISHAESSISRYKQAKNVEQELAALAQFWQRYLDTFTVETPDPAMNAMLKPLQSAPCFHHLHLSRYLSYYQWGWGRVHRHPRFFAGPAGGAGCPAGRKCLLSGTPVFFQKNRWFCHAPIQSPHQSGKLWRFHGDGRSLSLLQR
jgi:cellobiose phosphorylase